MKKLIIWAALLCLLLTACTQAVPPEQLNHSTVSTTVPITPASTTTIPTTVPSVDTTLPTTPSTMKPTYATMTVKIEGKERYDLMKAAVTDDAALEDFVATERHPWLKERENIVALLKLLNSLPVFSVENATYVSVNYERHDDDLHIVYRLGDVEHAHWYRFEYELDKEENAQWKEQIIKEIGTTDFKSLGKDNNIKCLQELDLSGSNFAKTMKIYRVEVDGSIIGVTYKNIYTDVSAQTPEDVFATIRLEETFDDALKDIPDKPAINEPSTLPTTVSSIMTTTPKETYTLPGTIPTTMPGTTNPYISQ